jgi:hypothetical protein
MNQTKKRLHIIKLAISITDIETIQLQILKLTPMQTDASIQEIISLLQKGSYVKSQELISIYMDTAPDEILQRSSQQEYQATIPNAEGNLIDEFELFLTPSVHSQQNTTQMDAHDFDTLLHTDNTKETSDVDTFFEEEETQETDTSTEKDAEEDTFFEKKESLEEESPKEDSNTEETPEEKAIEQENIEQEILENTIENPTEETKKTNHEKPTTEVTADTNTKENTNTRSYEPMPHITQKLIHMEKRYPSHAHSDEKFETVETLLEKISNEGYTESDIEEMIQMSKKLITIEQPEEAAELLYICASTESQFAQFMLARELYSGTLLKRNIESAFILMSTLAKDNYPEALCDLGQFFENGIGTIPDLIKAESLYKEAMKLGIKRASKHHARLQKQNRGFF